MIVTLPEKICPHCSGTKWYVDPMGSYSCYEMRKESRQRNKENFFNIHGMSYSDFIEKELTDTYIRTNLKRIARSKGVILASKDITAEQIIENRKSIISFRESPVIPSTHEKLITEKENLSDNYIKTVIISSSYDEYKRGLTNTYLKKSDISEETIIKYRETMTEIKKLQHAFKSPVTNSEKLARLEDFLMILETPTKSKYTSQASINNMKSAYRKEFGIRTATEVKNLISEIENEVLQELLKKSEVRSEEDFEKIISLDPKIISEPLVETPKVKGISIEEVILSLQRIEDIKKEIRIHLNRIEELLQTI